MIDPEVLDKIKRACCPQKAIYDIANYVETDIIPPINEATNTANAAAAQANSAYNRATDALNTANAVAEDVSRSLVDLNASGDGSTVTLNAPRNTGNPATTPLPVADATKAGVMNSATYVNLQNLNTRVSSLENQTTTYIVSFTNDNPTQDEINNAYKTAYPTAPFPPIDGTTVIDSTRQLYYRWVKNGAIWLKTTGFVVSQFTNETLGTIKGSTTAGQIQAETDGTGSLVGYDTLVSNIAQNTTAIETTNGRIDAVETKNTEQDTAINNVQSIANRAYVGSLIVPQANNVNINFTKGIGTPEVRSIPAVTTELAGIVTPTMFNQWNKLKAPNVRYESQNLTENDTTNPIIAYTNAIAICFRRQNGVLQIKQGVSSSANKIIAYIQFFKGSSPCQPIIYKLDFNTIGIRTWYNLNDLSDSKTNYINISFNTNVDGKGVLVEADLYYLPGNNYELRANQKVYFL